MIEALLHRVLVLSASRLPGRCIHGIGILLGVIALGVVAQAASAQTCPSSDPNANYNCPVGPPYLLPGWGNVPWAQPQYFTTIQTGDVDGDGQAELIGRDARGLHIYKFNSASGIWQPVFVEDGSAELVLMNFSDRNGWAGEEYYSTIKLVKLDASPAKLVGRARSGLVVFEFLKGPTTALGFPTGRWHQITTGGPFIDKEHWNVAPYYQTLRYGMIDGSSNASVIAWGAQGISTFTWNGSGWTPQAQTSAFGDAASADSRELISLQLANVDATGRAKLLTVDSSGLTAFQFVAGTGWQRYVNDDAGLFGNFPCGADRESCAYTLQTMVLDSTRVPAVIARRVGCTAGGVLGVKLDAGTRQWASIYGTPSANGPFDDCAPGFSKEDSYRTIRSADLDGDGVDELLGRGPGGILAYRWNSTTKTWTQIVNNTPALSDTLWASDPSYWQSIRTAKIGAKTALLARGPTGVRTWVYNGSTLASPLPYGNFPPLDANTYAAINRFLNLGIGITVRDLYTGPADTASGVLRDKMRELTTQGTGCPDETSADPPQYANCAPLSGTTNPTYTTTVNQLVKELWYAANVVDHYTTLQSMQTALFTTDGSTLPAIDANLQLPQAKDQSTAMNWLALFDGILFVVGDLVGEEFSDAVTYTADAMNAVLSGASLFQRPQKAASLAQKYADILSTVANMNSTAQSTVPAQKHHILGDYSLLGTVGQLVGSQVWTLEEGGYLSVSRFGFTYWVMQSLLPTVWNQYQVVDCINDFYTACTAPPNGINMQTYSASAFTGFLPKQTPCQNSCSIDYCQTICQFDSFPSTDNIVNLVFGPLTPQCKYSSAGTSWTYPSPNAPGCSLGAANDMFALANGWQFHYDYIDVTNYVGTSISLGTAANLNDPTLKPQLSMQMVGPLYPPVDLRTAQLQVGRLLRETGGAEELFKNDSGADFVPVSLTPQPQATPGRAVFETPPGHKPHIVATVQSKPGRALNFAITVDEASFIDPMLCVGQPDAYTRLHVQLQLSGGGLPAPANFAQILDWRCEVDQQGTLRTLRAASKPAWGLSFGR